MQETTQDKNKEWIGVDLDGTLATFDLEKWAENSNYIGDPIQLMVNRTKQWITEGKKVKIFTARVGTGAGWSDLSQATDEDTGWIDNQRKIVQDWTEKHIGVRLEVTATNDWAMRGLWDDRAVQVITNTGTAVEDLWKDAFHTLLELFMVLRVR
jgi:hypothetical protein